MQLKKFTLGAIFLVTLGLSGIHAQEAIPAAGGETSGSGGSVSYSVGQVVYTLNIGTNGSIMHGVQQPYEISIISEVEEATGINLLISAYPNPATHFLILEILEFDQMNLWYELYDIDGQLLENKRIITDETVISMNNLVSSAYLLRIINGNQELKSFKIIKN
jgi:hypothetical protein